MHLQPNPNSQPPDVNAYYLCHSNEEGVTLGAVFKQKMANRTREGTVDDMGTHEVRLGYANRQGNKEVHMLAISLAGARSVVEALEEFRGNTAKDVTRFTSKTTLPDHLNEHIPERIERGFHAGALAVELNASITEVTEGEVIAFTSTLNSLDGADVDLETFLNPPAATLTDSQVPTPEQA